MTEPAPEEGSTTQYMLGPALTPVTSPSGQRLAQHLAKKNYELLGEIGRGGMGVVYLALDKKLNRKVALKTLSPERIGKDNSLARFEREARTFAQIRHPHIAMLYEFEDDGPTKYLALEYIEGFDLEAERRRGRKWAPREAAALVRSLASALEHTHNKGILHRDIKPGNILVERLSGRVVLTDFGLAKGRKDETLTATGFAVGTPAYMAPEQITDQFNVKPDGRSDIFSLGTVFYEMITGAHPFLAKDDLTTMRNIVQQPAKPPSRHGVDVPPELETIIMAMLRPHPNDRIANAGLVAEGLQAFLDGKPLPDEFGPPVPQRTPTAPVMAQALEEVEKAAAAAGDSHPASRSHSSEPAIPPRGLTMKSMIIIASLVGVGMLLLGFVIAFLVLR